MNTKMAVRGGGGGVLCLMIIRDKPIQEARIQPGKER